MTEVKIFTNQTCVDLLSYRENESIRRIYNGDTFDFAEANFLPQTLKLNFDISHSLGVRPADDLDSSIKIFEALKNIDLVQANDKRIWVSLAHSIFYKYAKERWKIDKDSSDDALKDRFHFEGIALRQRNQHSIARLWWAARITYNENMADPYELTRVLWEKQDFYQNLIDRKYSTYKNTLNGFLSFYSRNRHLDAKRDLRRLFKGLNAFGGVRVLSMLSQSEIENQLSSLSKFYKMSVA